MVAEKTAKNFRGLLYFAAPCTVHNTRHAASNTWNSCREQNISVIVDDK